MQKRDMKTGAEAPACFRYGCTRIRTKRIDQYAACSARINSSGIKRRLIVTVKDLLQVKDKVPLIGTSLPPPNSSSHLEPDI